MARPKKTLEDLPDGWKKGMITIAKEGGSNVEIKAYLGCISNDLWYRLIDENDEFSETVSTCNLLCQVWWEKIGKKGMFMGGKDNPFNSTIYTFNMKNRFGWADKQESKVDHTSKGEKIELPMHSFVKT